jgi:endonuclease/exonuclease/phosphatase (EEP) superfamily protein YafD
LRNDQLQALGEWAAEQTGPLLIAGDLNTTSWSPAWKRLTEPAGLADTRQGHGPQSTWPGFSKLFYVPLDHVLVRDLGVTGRRVLPDIGSDHRPVVVDLVVE